jgi:multidrug efflux pump subunit AcrA (membrane-fusion protein)
VGALWPLPLGPAAMAGAPLRWQLWGYGWELVVTLVAAMFILVRINRHEHYVPSDALQHTVLEKPPYTPQGSEERKMAMKHLSRTSLAWYPLALALALLLLWGAGSRQETPRAPAVAVTIIQVTPRAIPIYKEYPGATDATETAAIRARVDGFIEQRLFEPGQLVKAHQLLYVLDQGLYHAEVQKTKAAVAKAEAELRFVKDKEGVEVLRSESRLTQSRAALVKVDWDVTRYRSMVKQEAAPQQDLDVALAQQQVLREDVNLRKAESDQTKL